MQSDVLFGVTPDGAEREIAQTREAAQNADGEEAIELWKNLLKRYPHNGECLFGLARAYCWGKTAEGFESSIPLYERVLDEVTDDGIRSSSLEELCRCYRETGNIEAAIRTANRGAGWRGAREFLLTLILESTEYNHSVQVWISMCAQELAWNLRNLSFDDINEKITACEKALEVLDLIYYDGNKMWSDNVYINVRTDLVHYLAEAGKYDDVCEQLAILVEEMSASDSLPLGEHGYEENMFLDTIHYKHTIPNAHRECLEDLLSQSVLAPIRERKDFKDI